MDPRICSRMIFHGVIVIFLGLLAGFPYIAVVTGDLAGEERAWRMAHLEGVLNGLVLLAVAAGGGRLVLSAAQQRWVALGLVAAGYGNVVAATIGATFGVRGLGLQGPVSNFVVFTLFGVAIVGVLGGLALVAWGAHQAAAAPSLSRD